MEDKLQLLNIKLISPRSESTPDLSEYLFSVEELSLLDDLATSCTVDIYSKRKTEKVLDKPCQLDQEVLKEVFERFSKDKNLERALHGIACLLRFGTDRNLGQLMLQANTKSFLEGLLKHLIGYLKCFPDNIYNAGFTLKPCDQFGKGCKIISTKVWKKNEIMYDLWGSLAIIPKEDPHPIITAKNDFSTIHCQESNGRTEYLMLGPIRFVNSNCKPNAEFYIKKSQVFIRLLKKVNPLEEILVKYGKEFFHEGFPCLCNVCVDKRKISVTSKE